MITVVKYFLCNWKFRFKRYISSLWQVFFCNKYLFHFIITSVPFVHGALWGGSQLWAWVQLVKKVQSKDHRGLDWHFFPLSFLPSADHSFHPFSTCATCSSLSPVFPFFHISVLLSFHPLPLFHAAFFVGLLKPITYSRLKPYSIYLSQVISYSLIWESLAWWFQWHGDILLTCYSLIAVSKIQVQLDHVEFKTRFSHLSHFCGVVKFSKLAINSINLHHFKKVEWNSMDVYWF